MHGKLSDSTINVRTYKINWILAFFFTPIAIWPLYYGKFISFTEVGIIYAIAFAVQMILELPSGALADMIGRKYTIALAWIAKITYVLFIIFAQNFWFLLLGEIFDKIGEALYSGSGTALIYDSLKENNKEGLFEKVESRGYFLATVSNIFASIVGGLTYIIDPRLPFIILLVVWIIAFFHSLLFQEPKLDSEKASLKVYFRQNIDGFKHIFRHRKIALTSVYSITIAFAFLTGIWVLYQKAGNEMGFDVEYVGIIIAFTYACRALGTYFYPQISKTINSGKLKFGSVLALIQSASSFLLITPFTIVAILGLGIRNLTDGFSQPFLTTLQNREIESKYRATSLSSISLLTVTMLSVFNPIIGKGIDLWGARTVIAITGLIPLLIAFPISIMLAKHDEKNKTEQILKTTQ